MTHKRVTLPPLHTKFDPVPVQFDDELNRGHTVLLHPAETKKSNSDQLTTPRAGRTKTIVDTHESRVLYRRQRLRCHPCDDDKQ